MTLIALKLCGVKDDEKCAEMYALAAYGIIKHEAFVARASGAGPGEIEGDVLIAAIQAVHTIAHMASEAVDNLCIVATFVYKFAKKLAERLKESGLLAGPEWPLFANPKFIDMKKKCGVVEDIKELVEFIETGEAIVKYLTGELAITLTEGATSGVINYTFIPRLRDPTS